MCKELRDTPLLSMVSVIWCKVEQMVGNMQHMAPDIKMPTGYPYGSTGRGSRRVFP
jgi:hypothetical protein